MIVTTRQVGLACILAAPASSSALIVRRRVLLGRVS